MSHVSAPPGWGCRLIREAATYRDGVISILDRRRYPLDVVRVDCRSVEEAAAAIEQMVTQSAGPARVAAYAMCLAAREPAANGETRARHLADAATRLVDTRPTNDQIANVVNEIRAFASAAPGGGTEEEILGFLESRWRARDAELRLLGSSGADVVPPTGRVLTHCWAEHGLIAVLEACIARGDHPGVYCTETRPYLQGARLTASSVMELGLEATVVTDGMAPWLMAQGMVDVVVVGADRVAADGSVVNKIGTLSVALGAKHAGIPFYACIVEPDLSVATGSQVAIEARDPAEVLSCLGVRTAAPGSHGWYPAFDVTPAELVTGLITPRGVLAPPDLAGAFDDTSRSVAGGAPANAAADRLQSSRLTRRSGACASPPTRRRARPR